MSQNKPDSTPMKNKHVLESDNKMHDSNSKFSLLDGYGTSNVQSIPS